MVQRRPYPSRSGFFGVLMLLSVSGCATTPSPEAARVRIVQDATQVSGCQLLGEVKGSSLAPLVGVVGHTMDNARTEMRDKAVAQGGNVVLITQNNANTYGTWLYGEAYRCPPQ
jgi:hypothetical protein